MSRKTLDLCTRCRNTKAIKRDYEDDPRYPYGCDGKCDRCERWSTGLWALTERSVLDRLADV